MNDWLQSMLQHSGSGGAVLLASIAVATLVSEDLACIAAGLLIAQGSIAFAPATGACFTGIFTGDMALVWLGRTVGRSSLEARPLRWWISADAVRRAERWFVRRGPGLILASRFMPGMRLPTYVAAGVLRAPLARFVGWFILACALWTPLLVGAAVIFGEASQRAFKSWSSAVPALVAAALLALVFSRLAVALSSWRGRRLLLSRWRRLTRWEFWPMWAVYPPVVVYIVWLSLRHRSFTLFTAVNPGIGAGGGLVGESKSEILKGLETAGDAIARWNLIPAGPVATRVAAFNAFMAREQLSFPVVLKPDVGERGTGVVIAKDHIAAERVLRDAPGPTIAQAYVPGVEFGVFYYRLPSASRGEIFAITEKQLVILRGDGRRTLEELILADDRAVCMAAFFLKKFATRLDEVPDPDETITLSELGTHSRGALFLDGTHRITPALMDVVERVSRAHHGFHFGRYDVRTASVDALQRGEFTVIELNGLTSEATSIYDPRHSLIFAWRTLCRQWAIAFSIAEENRRRGVRSLSVGEIWQLVAPSRAST